MYYRRSFLLCGLIYLLHYALSATATISIDIDIFQLPVNASVLPFQIVVQNRNDPNPVTTIYSYNISITGTDNYIYNLTAVQEMSYGPLIAHLPLSSVAIPGTLIVTTLPPSGSSDTSIVRYLNIFTPPFITGWQGRNITTAGLSTVKLETSSVLPLIHANDLQIYIECASSSSSSHIPPTVPYDAYTIYDITGKSRSMYSYIIPGTITWNGIQFTTESLPSTGCGWIFIYVSYTNLLYTHYTGLVVPVTPFQPIKVVTFFPGTLQVLWASSHNLARLALGSKYPGAVDMYTYYTNSWHPEPVTGNDLATLTMKRSILYDQAQLMLCVGGEYYDTVAYLAPQYPNVSFLVTSDIRANLTARYGTIFQNAATGHGKVYEALFYMGFIGATTSRTGILGIILTLDHPSTYAMANAYGLGAKAAKEAGLTSPYSSNRTEPIVYTWTIGDFDLLWNELTATKDLLNRGVDTIVITTDNAFVAREYAHSRGVYTFSLYEDGRKTQGDNVLLSFLLPTQVIYSEFIQRIVEKTPFGPETWIRGLGAGVELTDPSPFVPLLAQAEYKKRISYSRLRDNIEEVFCGTLIDNNGNVRLNGTNGTTYSGVPSVIGEGNRICLSSQDIITMNWVLDNIYYPPENVVCGDSNNRYNDAQTFCGIWVPPVRILNTETVVPYTMPNSFRTGVIFFPIFLIVLVVIFTFFIFYYRQTRTIRFANPAFLVATNIGAVLYAISPMILIYAVEWTDSLCLAHTWIQGIGFSLLYGALFVKMYRVHRLFNNRKLRRIHMRDLDVGRLLAFVIFFEVILLLIITYVFPPEAELIRDLVLSFTTLTSTEIDTQTLNPFGLEKFTSLPTYVQFYSCGVGGIFSKRVASTEVFLSAFQFCLLLWGAFLSFRTRKVSHEDLNESSYVALSIYTTVGCEVVAFILDPIMDSAPQIQYYSHIIRLGIPAIATLILLYVPKMFLIFKQNRRNNTSENNPNSNNNPNGKSTVIVDGKKEAVSPIVIGSDSKYGNSPNTNNSKGKIPNPNGDNDDDNNVDDPNGKYEFAKSSSGSTEEDTTKSKTRIVYGRTAAGSRNALLPHRISDSLSTSTGIPVPPSSDFGTREDLEVVDESGSTHLQNSSFRVDNGNNGDNTITTILKKKFSSFRFSSSPASHSGSTTSNNNMGSGNLYALPSEESTLANAMGIHHHHQNNGSSNTYKNTSSHMDNNRSSAQAISPSSRNRIPVPLPPEATEEITTILEHQRSTMHRDFQLENTATTIPVGDSVIFSTNTQLVTIQTMDHIVGIDTGNEITEHSNQLTYITDGGRRPDAVSNEIPQQSAPVEEMQQYRILPPGTVSE